MTGTHERAAGYLDTHYHFSDGHLASVKGYEFCGKMAELLQDEGRGLPPEGHRVPTSRSPSSCGVPPKANSAKGRVFGTPGDCLQQLTELCWWPPRPA